MLLMLTSSGTPKHVYKSYMQLCVCLRTEYSVISWGISVSGTRSKHFIPSKTLSRDVVWNIVCACECTAFDIQYQTCPASEMGLVLQLGDPTLVHDDEEDK